MIDEKGLSRRNIVLGSIGNEPFERDGGVDDQVSQRRPRSRAVRASEVEIGLRRSARVTSLANALRVFGSSIGRAMRRASANAARRRNELRVSPAFRAAASITRRSDSGRETNTLRMTRVYPSDIRIGKPCVPEAAPLLRESLAYALGSSLVPYAGSDGARGRSGADSYP